MLEKPKPRPEFDELAKAIIRARRMAERLAAERPSRELSLVLTKLDEAGLWLLWKQWEPD